MAFIEEKLPFLTLKAVGVLPLNPRGASALDVLSQIKGTHVFLSVCLDDIKRESEKVNLHRCDCCQICGCIS